MVRLSPAVASASTCFLFSVQICEGENIKLDQELDRHASILDKTELDLEQARSEGLLTKNHLNKIINKLEKLSREKLDIEEKILDLLQDQITTDKFGQHRGKLLRDAQEERRMLEISMANSENDLSITILELEKWRGNVQRAKENVEKVKKKHNEADFEANTITDEIEKLKTAAKNKLVQLDSLHKQLEQLIEQLGGKEMNLKEIQVNIFDFFWFFSGYFCLFSIDRSSTWKRKLQNLMQRSKNHSSFGFVFSQML
jgi:coiled-coil domain-containing protein 40